MAQKLLKKPKISYIHLDERGSFIWLKIDGEKMVDFELNGNGYSAKLKAFIAKRDKALEEASKAKTVKKVVEAEPGME